MHTSNLYYNVPIIHAAERVKKASGMDRVFFTNSGTEAIEGAIKAAKKYAYTRDGHAGHEIIAMIILSMEEVSEHSPSPEINIIRNRLNR